jgi:hypothetical protein
MKLKLISKFIRQLKSGFKICQHNSFRIQGQKTNKETHTLQLAMVTVDSQDENKLVII